ncbi:MAG: hypothetical protein V4448_08805 [Pseudomonadota bacterium]
MTISENLLSSTYGSGCYRRRVILIADKHVVTAALEDDYHHFVLQLHHDGSHVTGITSDAKRFPWSTCPSASPKLQQLIGAPLSYEVLLTQAGLDAHTQCTHQLDLAVAAIMQAVRGGHRQYDAVVSDAQGDRCTAALSVDGQQIIEWTLDGSTIVAPAAQAGLNLRKINMAAMTLQDIDEIQAFGLLRRAVMIAGGRRFDFDRLVDMSIFAERMTGACFAFQPERIPLAKRAKGSIRDFTIRPEFLLQEFSSHPNKLSS